MGKLKNILKYLFSSNKKEKKCDLVENKEKTFHPEVEKYRPTIDVLCYSLQIYHSLNEITKCIETLNKYPDVADKIVSDIKEQLEEIVNREKGTNGNEREIPNLEQKPTGWSEEDEDMLKSIIATCELAEQDRDCSPARHLFKMQTNWLKSLKDRLQLQPKQEWSKEDEQKLNRIYSIIGQAADTHAFSTSCRLIGDKECIELQDFLKYLRPQSKHKLGTENDTTVDEAVEYLEKYAEEIQGGNSKLYILGLAKRLENLKPQKQWKPTEGMIKALTDALSLAKSCGKEYAFDLRELLEQLKKL